VVSAFQASRPKTIEDLARICREPGPVGIVGSDSRGGLRHSNVKAARLELAELRGIVSYEPNDLVVVVRAGTPLEELQHGLAERRQCIPLAEHEVLGTVGGALSVRRPQGWRDWVLGLTVVLADGTVARCGSKAVKNVAGYDVQKLFIGARGTLGVVAEVILRTYPAENRPVVGEPQAEDLRLRDWRSFDAFDPTIVRFMKRAKAIFDPTNKLNPGEFRFL
jgi:glycolate oxidase FAD binding subunit